MREHKFPLREDTVFQIPHTVLVETEMYLRASGTLGRECTIFWGGIGKGDVAHVRSVYYLRQTATAVSVEVNPDAVHEMYGRLDLRKEILLAQVHTHPGAAFHSGTDDSFPATFLVGFLSIVVPNFCSTGLKEFRHCVVLVHQGRGLWSKVEPSEIQRRLKVQEA